MTWIETHDKLERHPKVLDLMNLMGWNKNETLGVLIRFWWWCLEYAEDGDLRPHSPQRIAGALDMMGDYAVKFVPSMISTGWIDEKPNLRVHDWWDYIGNFLMSKYKHHPSKWRRVRRLYRGKKNGAKNSSKNGTPNLTIPNHTIPNKRVTREIVFPEELTRLSKWTETWTGWEAHRREIGKPLKPTGIQKQLKFLVKQPDPIAVIEQSIRNGWQGLFVLKNGQKSGHRRPVRDAIAVNRELMRTQELIQEMEKDGQKDS
jgi:hypothetical protein